MSSGIQIFTGNGKGKTTSALGLIPAVLGQGKKIFIGQFLKSGKYSEMKSLNRFPDQITVEHYGLGKFVKGCPSEEDKSAGRQGYEKICTILRQGVHDLVIMDEGNIAVKYGIISEQALLDLFALKPEHVELVVTGRGATPAVMDKADRVVEMSAEKHYYLKGVKARVGIEK